ncbi:hypothetical protein QWZ16_15245 [Vibrio ostreicida]|uniref:Double zinc ribbon domain-containing protein n=1 Tax=Vibrio ostreicida TaxID=526588 RepID=A0ABT8BY70_9VIBR|nr:hypothetical protein [Vibrio ostreicida]MDN3611030.1 hypothetical protein [Vibrio ostreicida]
MLTEWVNKLTAKVLPNHCGLCRLPVEPDLAGSVFCAACLAYFSSQPRCQCCGLATHAVVRHCGQCLLNKPLWSRLYCVGEYQAPLSRYVHRLKDGGQYWHAKTLSSLLLPSLIGNPTWSLLFRYTGGVIVGVVTIKVSIWLGIFPRGWA